MSTASDVFRREANELLRDALELPDEDRSGFLDQRCAENPKLREEVRQLLGALKKAGQFLETPALPRTGDMFEAVAQHGVKDRLIGHFRLKSIIASGGMGTVYEAEQESPRRTVALKVINAGIASANGLKRFEYEAQYLARLQHPNVAQVFDAGLHEEQTVLGKRELPYFAMELISGGKPITDATQLGGFSIRRRLEMFLKVADAIHHGHQKGIIHRDLKPSNILMDQNGEPKIIDYGVARLVGEEQADHMTRTLTGQLVGTLQYMSPEQCSRDPGDIDTRSDVYALGLVLYEMIAGQRPYSVHELQLDDATRVIREQQPASMSSIGCRAPRDLETIIRKALEKDRDRRYQSAAQMQEDVQRFLDDEPIEARPPSMFYQLRMFARRNRTPVTAAIAIGLTLLIAATISTVFAIRAARQRDVAVWNSYVGNVAAAEAAFRAGEFRRMRNHLSSAPEHLRGWEWRYLNRLAEPSLEVITDHIHMASAVRYSPDGKLLASSSRDGAVKIRSSTTGEIDHTLQHPGDIFGLSFSPDGSVLATGCSDGHVRIWSVTSGTLLKEVSDYDERILQLRYSPDGRYLIAGIEGGTVGIWETKHWTRFRAFDGHDLRARCVSIDGDNRHAYSGDDGGRLIVWDLEAGRSVAELLVDPLGVRDIEISADGSLLYCATVSGTVHVFNRRTMEEVDQIRISDSSVWSIALHPEGNLLAAGEADHVITLIDLTGANEPRMLRGHGELVHDLSFHPDGARLASASWDRTVRIWDVQPADRFQVLRIGNHEVLNVAVSPMGDRAATVGRDGTLRIWSLESGALLGSHTVPEVDLYSVNFSPDGQRVVIGGIDGMVRIVDTATGEAVRHLNGHDGVVYAVTFLADGERIISASGDNTARIWDVATGNVIHVLDKHSDGLWHVAVSPDGRTVATAARDSRAMVWNAETGALLHVLSGHQHDIYAAAFSPDGKVLATGSRDQSIRIWNVEDGSLIEELTGHGQFVTGLAFLPDGSRLISASWFRTIKFWDVHAWQEVGSLNAHDSAIRGVAVSPDGTRVLTASHDGTARIWDELTITERRARESEYRKRRAEGVDLVQRLMADDGDIASIAKRLREDTAIDDRTRQDALNVLLSEIRR